MYIHPCRCIFTFVIWHPLVQCVSEEKERAITIIMITISNKRLFFSACIAWGKDACFSTSRKIWNKLRRGRLLVWHLTLCRPLVTSYCLTLYTLTSASIFSILFLSFFFGTEKENLFLNQSFLGCQSLNEWLSSITVRRD